MLGILCAILFIGVIVGGIGWFIYEMVSDPGPCRQSIKVGATTAPYNAYRLYTCDRRKGHEDDHLDYNEQYGWPQEAMSE